MLDGRNQMLIGGIGFAVFFSGALVASFTMTRMSNSPGQLLLVLLVTVVSIGAAVACAAVALRAYVRLVLAAVSRRLKSVEDRSIARDELQASKQRKIVANTEALTAGQDGIQNFLKREGSVQFVLDKLTVFERRVVASVESGELTIAEEVCDAIESLTGAQHREIARLRDELEVIRAGVNRVESDSRVQGPEMLNGLESLHATLDGVVPHVEKDIDALRSDVEAMRSDVGGIGEQSAQGAERLAQLLSNLDNSVHGAAGQLQQCVVELGETVTDIESTARASAPRLEKGMGNLHGSLGTLGSSVAEIGPQVARSVDALAKEVSTLHGVVEGTLPRIGQEVADLEVRIQEVRSSLDGMDAHLGQKVEVLAKRMGTLNESAIQTLPQLGDQVEALSGAVVSMRAGLDESIPQMGLEMAHLHEKMKEVKAVAVASPSSFDGDEDGSGRLQKQIADLGDTVNTVLRLADTAKNDVKALYRHVDRAGVESVRQLEALLQLLTRVDTSARRFPQSGGFAMNPDSILLLSDLIQRHKPKRILELGSGTSTVWTGTFARSVGAEVLSIDHLEEYHAQTAQMIEDFDLGSVVDLRLAPLVNVETDGKVRSWYDPAVLDGIRDIDMLIVDGPPESTGPESRYPAFPVLRDRLALGALIVIDDLHREQEAQMVESWMAHDAELAPTIWADGLTGDLQYGKLESR